MQLIEWLSIKSSLRLQLRSSSDPQSSSLSPPHPFFKKSQNLTHKYENIFIYHLKTMKCVVPNYISSFISHYACHLPYAPFLFSICQFTKSPQSFMHACMTCYLSTMSSYFMPKTKVLSFYKTSIKCHFFWKPYLYNSLLSIHMVQMPSTEGTKVLCCHYLCIWCLCHWS